MSEPTDVWKQYPNEIDGVTIQPDQCVAGSNFYDMSVPHLTLHDGAWRKNYWRQQRGVVTFNDMDQPTEDDLRGYIKVYEAEFGHPPAHLLLVRGQQQFTADPDDPPLFHWGIAIQGPHDPCTFDWPACEWCGSTEKPHTHPCPNPSMSVTREGTPMWQLPVLQDERDPLIALLSQQDEPWAAELVRRLESPRPNLPRSRT